MSITIFNPQFSLSSICLSHSLSLCITVCLSSSSLCCAEYRTHSISVEVSALLLPFSSLSQQTFLFLYPPSPLPPLSLIRPHRSSLHPAPPLYNLSNLRCSLVIISILSSHSITASNTCRNHQRGTCKQIRTCMCTLAFA